MIITYKIVNINILYNKYNIISYYNVIKIKC